MARTPRATATPHKIVTAMCPHIATSIEGVSIPNGSGMSTGKHADVSTVSWSANARIGARTGESCHNSYRSARREAQPSGGTNNHHTAQMIGATIHQTIARTHVTGLTLT